MGTAEEDLTEPSASEECCCGPMFPRELKGLSPVLASDTSISISIRIKEAYALVRMTTT